jgi:hypothetical protein
MVLSASWVGYENRQTIYDRLFNSKISNTPVLNRTISAATKQEIDRYIYGSAIVVGIQIHLVDFQKNSKSIIYTGSDIPGLRLAWQQFFGDSLSVLPLFNADALNNGNVIDLINGDIICSPYSKTTTAVLVPASVQHINTVCMSSIPPVYGKFAGIISIHLKQSPSSIELDQIKTMSKVLSSTIYDRDLR